MSRAKALLIIVVACFSILSVQPTVLAERYEVPEEIKKELEKVLKEHIKELNEKKDEEGRKYINASTSNVYRARDDGKYVTTFFKSVVSGDTKTVGHYELVLGKDDEGKWAITDTIVVSDNVQTLNRPPLDHEKFFAFDAFSFDREGFKVTSGPGTGVIRMRNSVLISRSPKINRHLGGWALQIEFYSDSLDYQYAPPDDTGYAPRYRIVKETLKKDLIFEADRVSLIASPQNHETFIKESFTNWREVPIEELPSSRRSAILEMKKDIKDKRKKDNRAGFEFPFEEEENSFFLQIFKKRSEHWFGMAFDALDAKEVNILVGSKFFPLYRYYSDETRRAGLPLRALEHRHERGARDYELKAIKGTVELALEHPEEMYGNVAFTITARRKLDKIGYGISMLRRGRTDEIKSPDLTIYSIEDEKGRALSYVRTGANRGRVYFREPLEKGESLTLHLDWKNARAIGDFSYSYKYMSRGGWLPFVRFGDMIDDFELTIKTPAKFKTLGIGKKLSEEVEGEVRITRWKAGHPVTFPTIIFGEYYEVESSVKATKLDGTPIPVTIHVDKAAMSDFGIRPKQLLPLADYAANSINLYSRMFRVDYPFAKLDLVNDPIGGALYGQAPSSLIYLGSLVFRGTATIAGGAGQDISRTGADRGNATRISRFLKSVVAHEVGHQWWGASTANANQGNYWFVESLAEYSSAIFLEQMFGKGEYDAQVEEWRENILAANLIASVQEATEMLSSEGPLGGYQAAIYNKGPYAFHVLRSTFGDEKFFSFMQTLALTFAKKEIATSDMIRLSEIVFGDGIEGTMDWFWGQWIRGVGLPEYTYDLKYRSTEDGKYLVEGKVRQKLVLGQDDEVIESEFFRGAVPIQVEFRSGEPHTEWILVEGEETSIRFKVDKKPKKIVFNGGGEMLTESQRAVSF